MHVFIKPAQRTPTRQAVLMHINAVRAHLPCHHWLHSALCCTAHFPQEFSKLEPLVNAFGVFRAFYRGHFSHNFRVQGVTLKGKAVATKCLFQIYSQLLDICSRLVLKTAEELIGAVANSKRPLLIIPKVQLRLRVTRKTATALVRYPQKLVKIVCW